MAFLGYYMHWTPEALLNMPHDERQRWCSEVSKINKVVGRESGASLESRGRPLA